jgi:hypothetical protein
VKTLAEALLARGVSGDDLVNAEVCQRRLGGTIDTNVLELGLCSESEMEELLSKVQDLPLPPLRLLQRTSVVPPDLFPRALAERYGLAPLGIWEKRLALLVLHPIDLTAIDEISFLLSRPLRLYAGTEIKQREVLSTVYGIALPPRFVHLRARLGRQRPGEGDPATARSSPAPVATAPAREKPHDPSLRVGAPEATAEVSPLTTGWAGRAGPGIPAPTVAEALSDLRKLSSRDALVGAVLRHLLVAFDFVVFYSRRGSEMTVFEASGVDFGGANTSHTAVSLDRPSSMRMVVEGRAAYVGPIPPGDPLESSLASLGRSRLRVVFLAPVVIRDRTVAVVYGDRGGEALAPSQLSEVSLVVSQLGPALERVLKSRGRDGAAPPAEHPPAVENYSVWVGRFLSGTAEERREAAVRLSLGGRAAAEALGERFPGPLFVQRSPLGDLPVPERFGPLVAMLVSLGDDALPVLEWLARYGAGERRFWAGALLGKLKQAAGSVADEVH